MLNIYRYLYTNKIENWWLNVGYLPGIWLDGGSVVPRTDAVLAAAGREARAPLRRRPQGDAPHLHRAHQRGYVLARVANEISRDKYLQKAPTKTIMGFYIYVP